ncbi:T20G5.12 protein, partial [Aphelenchoides avenae]
MIRCLCHASFQNTYFRLDECPVQAAADIQYCAAQGKDHRECCVRNGVTTTLAGEKCWTFCDQRPGNVTQLDFSYMSCYERFENMKGCFWHESMASDAYTKQLQLDYARSQGQKPEH